MKKIICLAILAALSAPVSAEGLSSGCHLTAQLAQIYLKGAKLGSNGHAELLGDVDRMTKMGAEVSIVILTISQTMWENRHTYTPAKAYKEGYRICMEMRRQFERE